MHKKTEIQETLPEVRIMYAGTEILDIKKLFELTKRLPLEIIGIASGFKLTLHLMLVKPDNRADSKQLYVEGRCNIEFSEYSPES